MIQLNLLPDVKLEYIKAQRGRRMAISISLLVCVVTIGILLLLLGSVALQKKHSSDLSKDIARDSATLQDKENITRVLTVQNQLESLPALHDQKPAVARLFGYLNEVTPSQVSITALKIDFDEQSFTITGVADSLSSVNKYIDTLKFTKYTVKGSDQSAPAFKDVVLASFNLTNVGDTTGKPANYEITLTYDPTIFDVTQDVKLDVPDLTTTRSTLSRPTDLFQAKPTNNSGGAR